MLKPFASYIFDCRKKKGWTYPQIAESLYTEHGVVVKANTLNHWLLAMERSGAVPAAHQEPPESCSTQSARQHDPFHRVDRLDTNEEMFEILAKLEEVGKGLTAGVSALVYTLDRVPDVGTILRRCVDELSSDAEQHEIQFRKLSSELEVTKNELQAKSDKLAALKLYYREMGLAEHIGVWHENLRHYPERRRFILIRTAIMFVSIVVLNAI